jgi:outer membrane protein OmpA-like peptidoglycan-associated protein
MMGNRLAERFRGGWVGPLSAALLTALLMTDFATAEDPDSTSGPQSVAGLREALADAKEHGAKRYLPVAYGSLESRVEEAEKNFVSTEELAEMHMQATRLQAQARFLDDMRQHRSPLEALLNRYDRALREIAALELIELDPVLSGDAAAEALVDQLTAEILHRQVTIDSLRLANRYLDQTVGVRAAQQESTVTALRVEVSSLRKELWDTQLKAGVAEADRSEAEHRLAADRERADAVQAIAASLDASVGDIVMKPDGTVVMRLHGFSFGVGSATLPADQSELVDEVAEAVQRFPDSKVRIEGHTDDTGSRDVNLRLSRRRAETVARMLADRLGVGPETLETAGVGPDKPVASNATAEGRSRNRRIDIIISPEG